MTVQKLRFDETSAILIGNLEPLNGVKTFNIFLSEPFNSSSNSSNSIDFYKYTIVDIMNHTQTGYKTIKNKITNRYSFEKTITSGLTYNIITPITRKVYSYFFLSGKVSSFKSIKVQT